MFQKKSHLTCGHVVRCETGVHDFKKHIFRKQLDCAVFMLSCLVVCDSQGASDNFIVLFIYPRIFCSIYRNLLIAGCHADWATECSII